MKTIPLQLDMHGAEQAAQWELSVLDAGRQVPENSAFVRWFAADALARYFAPECPESAERPALEAHWCEAGEWGEWPGVLELYDPRKDAHRHILVSAQETAMEPRPVWPVRIDTDELDAWDYDAVAWCYTPKRRKLENPGRDLRGIFVGWAWADEVRSWQHVSVEPHPGHPFSSMVWQATCSRLSAPSTLLESLLGNAVSL